MKRLITRIIEDRYAQIVYRIYLIVSCVLILVFFHVPSSFSQNKRPTRVVAASQKAGQCTLTKFDAPRLRGFYLDETEQEISSILPAFHKTYESEKNPLFPQHLLNSDFREVRSEKLETDLTEFEDYRDVSFVWQFWNGHVVQLRITYEEYEAESLNAFLEDFTSTTGLPLKYFRISGKHTAVLRCDGVSIEIREGSYIKTEWVQVKSQITLTDTEAFAAINEEEKLIKEQRAKEEADKKAAEQKKKRTFKP